MDSGRARLVTARYWPASGVSSARPPAGTFTENDEVPDTDELGLAATDGSGDAEALGEAFLVPAEADADPDTDAAGEAEAEGEADADGAEPTSTTVPASPSCLP